MNRFALAKLQDGETLVDYKEGGNSMAPLIYSRQPVTISPVKVDLVEPGDIVVARVHGRVVCHLVLVTESNRVQIGNNHGRVNGWTGREKIYGIVTHVEDRARPNSLEKVKLQVD